VNKSVVDRKYVIVSGYYADERKTAPFSISKERFLDIWYENTLRYSTPQKIYLVNVSKHGPVKPYPEIDWINISENLGHVNDFVLTNDTKTLTGYTLSVLMGMLLAYNNKADFIYKEQDCLAFGSWVDELYRESRSKNKEMLLGRGHIKGYIEQSLWLCRHEFLLEFMNRYLSFNAGDYPLLPELKFAKIMEMIPDRIGFFDFGYGRIRPVQFDDKVFFIQQTTDKELSTLRTKGLIAPEKLKINFGCGSNVLSGWNNHDMDVDITKPLNYLDNQADNIFAEHVVEHLTIHDAYRFFEECCRILKPGGWLRVTLPSVSNILAKKSKEYIKFLHRNNWGGGEEDSAVKSIIFNHGHKSAWTRELLKAFLSNIGFETRDAELYTSCIPEFVGIEGHQRVIGNEFNEIESIVVEARKIVGNQVPGLDLKEVDVCNTRRRGLATFIENRNTQDAVQDVGVGSSRSSAQVSTIKRVLWVRTDSIGDNVLAVSMLPHIRKKFEHASITVLCQEHIAELYEACPFVDNVVGFNRKIANEDAGYRNEIINRLGALKPDVSLNSVFSSEPITHIFATECGAGECIAIEGDLCNISAELRQKYNQSYTKLLPSAGEHKPELARHRDFLKGLGVDVPPLEPVVWTSQEDENFAKEFFRKNNLKLENTIALFPAAQHSTKVYPFYHQILGSFDGFNIVILGGSDARPLAKKICESLHGKCHDLTGKTSIRQMASILRCCRLYIGADSAGAHIACAVGIPNIVVLGGGHFGRFVPYSPLTSVVCLPLDCYGCNWRCGYKRPHCVKDVAPQVFAEAVRQTLHKSSKNIRIFVQAASLWNPESGQPNWRMAEKFFDAGNTEIITVGGKPDRSLSNAPQNRYLVSAIVSTYNSEKYIRGCLEDLESQTIADKLEIIVINSGSEQNEESIVEEFQKKYGNIVYIKTEREGLYSAWNRAVKVASGQFLSNANTDDRHRKDAFEVMANTLLENTDIALVYGDQIVTDTPNPTFKNHHVIEWARRSEFSKERLLFYCCVGSQQMWRKSLNDEFGGFDETLTCAADWDFWLKIAGKHHFKRIPEFLGLYFYNKEGIEHGRRIHGLYERYAVGRRYNKPYMSAIPLYEARGNPLVSIVMAAYNAAGYIARAIESVLIQNYRNFELIVVDDGSTDRTAEIVRSFKNEPIKYFYKENGGVSSARNYALKKVGGSFVVILDSDDMITLDFIARHLRVFEQNPETDLVYCDDCFIDENDKPIRVMGRPEYSDQKALVSALFRYGWAILPFRTCIRKSVFDKIGLYDERLIMSEDYDMLRRFVSKGLRMRHLPAALYLRHPTANSLSRSFNAAKAKGHFEVVRKFTETFTAEQLFPDVRWENLPAEQKQLLAKCKTALVYVGIGEQYLTSNAPDFAETAFEMACAEMDDCRKIEPGSQQVRNLREKCRFIRDKRLSNARRNIYQRV